MEVFREKLTFFASRHKNEIRRDPVFRKQFQDMCARIGVDPLASSKGKLRFSILLHLLEYFMTVLRLDYIPPDSKNATLATSGESVKVAIESIILHLPTCMQNFFHLAKSNQAVL